MTNANVLYGYMTSHHNQEEVAGQLTDAVRQDRIDNSGVNARQFYKTMISDNTIFRSSALRTGNTAFEYALTGVLYGYGSRSDLHSFFDTWDPAMSWLVTNTSLDERLGLVYGADVQGTISSYIGADANNNLDSIIADMEEVPALDYVQQTAAYPAFSSLAPSIISEDNVGIVSDTVMLAEHHIYGSSRLGIQTYDSTWQNTYKVNQPTLSIKNLSTPVMWYSAALGDYITKGETEPWGHKDEGDTIVSRVVGRRYYEMTDHLGNVLATVLDRKTGAGSSGVGTLYDHWNADLGSVVDYYPGGMMMPGRYKFAGGDTSKYRFSTNGIEKVSEVAGLGNHYAALFGEYDPRTIRRWNTDPKPTIGESSYLMFAGNPIWHSDVLLDTSTNVISNKNGTYSVVGGKADGDRNIYVVNNGRQQKRTGQVIGKSLTEYSFLDDNGNAVRGAIINPNDRSGINFLNKDIINGDLSLLDYMPYATGGGIYDFKTKGIDKRPKGMSGGQYSYRGMPFEGISNFGNQDGITTTFGSARDFGNIAAGFVAGNNGLGWRTARAGFDALESYQKGGLNSEGQPTQRAERLGYGIGIRLHTDREVERIKRNAANPLGPKW